MAQFTYFDNGNPQDLINAILAPNPDINVDPNSIKVIYGHATYDDTVTSISFYDGSLPLNINSGIVLSSGNAAPPTENTSNGYSTSLNPDNTDPDMNVTVHEAFSGSGDVHDATIIEFDFTVTDLNIHGITLDLVFGSDEYPEFSNSSFVDIAAVYLNGQNIALFNGQPSQPLSVIDTNLQVGNFIDNTDGHLPIEYDGISNKLSIYAPLQPGVNHIKIGVANSGDQIYDSSLFISDLKGIYLQGSGIGAVTTYTDENDSITGTDNNEIIDAGAGNDFIDPGYGDDVVLAGPGDDTIIGGKGDNQIDGGEGFDIVKYETSIFDTYVKPQENDTIHIGENSDDLFNIEKIEFTDVALDADETLLEAYLQKLYIAYFGRAADPAGCQYWEDYIKNSGKPVKEALKEVVDLFSYSDEANKLYPGIKSGNMATQTLQTFVTSIYQNLFDRDPDPAGLEYWVDQAAQLQAQDSPVGRIINDIIDGARDEGAPDRTLIKNKMDVAWDFMKQLELHNEGWSDFYYQKSQELLDTAVDATVESVNAAYDQILQMMPELGG